MVTTGIRHLLVFCVVALCASAAHADPVDNPGNFTWQTGWGDLQFNQSTTITRTLGAASGSLDVDLDNIGDMTFNTFTVQSVSISGYTVLLQVLVGGSSGNLDASNWRLQRFNVPSAADQGNWQWFRQRLPYAVVH